MPSTVTGKVAWGKPKLSAQAELRESYPSPFYWAAFVLNGDAGEVSSQGEERSAPIARRLSGSPWMVIAGIAGLLGVLVMLVIVRRRMEG